MPVAVNNYGFSGRGLDQRWGFYAVGELGDAKHRKRKSSADEELHEKWQVLSQRRALQHCCIDPAKVEEPHANQECVSDSQLKARPARSPVKVQAGKVMRADFSAQHRAESKPQTVRNRFAIRAPIIF